MSLDINLVIMVDTGGIEPMRINLYDANITHNMAYMWRHADIRDILYESKGTITVETMLPRLRIGLAYLEEHINEMRALNPSNGWGNADDALEWLRNLIAVCEQHPKASLWSWP